MQILDLGGAWDLRRDGDEEAIPAQVPGCVHTDLLAAGKIEDPFVRDNESRLQWVGETEWVYRRDFEAPARLLEHERVLLRCHGLDTLATVTLNGVEVARTEDMFRTYEFDVKPLLRPGANHIEVRFASPIPVIEARQAARRIPSWGGPLEVKGRCWVRKEPCNFGWDWGPTLVTAGIWRPIELVGFDGARLGDLHVRQDHSAAGSVGLDVRAGIEGEPPAGLQVAVRVSFEGRTVAEETAPVGESGAAVALRVEEPRLWWPNGMGEQPLYTVRAELRDAAGEVLDAREQRIGLRTLRLDRHDDEWGESFQFVANGVPFFAKGANWIPADTFATRMTRERYEDLLHSAAAANMNMLRVWGGGIYEEDAFYDLCDELGICVWHDFMFACSTYPTFDEGFMENVRAEAEDNVRRLRHHPSIALWCGNNELEQGLVGDAWSDWQMSWEDYGRLFDRMLPEVVGALDPERDYWPCSPHSPRGDRRDHSNAAWGDAHLWDVWHGKKPFEWYRTCQHRFVSEFGFQSFPEPATVLGYTAPEDRNVTSYVMEHHQRSGIGNTTIMTYMLDWFRLPTQFEMTLWLSQILHGMAMKYAVEGWRRNMPRTMGALYWQLNDCWPVASWASIDYHGRWKALHYMARHFFAPLMVSGVEDAGQGTVEVHVTNDHRDARPLRLAWTVTDLAGTVVTEGGKEILAPAGGSEKVETLDLRAPLAEHGPRRLLVWLELFAGDERVADNLVLFARPKHLELAGDPGLSPTAEELEPGRFRVTVASKRPALWAWLELPGDAVYSDNFVHVRPGRPAAIEVTAPSLDGLRVRSLVDTYAE